GGASTGGGLWKGYELGGVPAVLSNPERCRERRSGAHQRIVNRLQQHAGEKPEWGVVEPRVPADRPARLAAVIPWPLPDHQGDQKVTDQLDDDESGGVDDSARDERPGAQQVVQRLIEEDSRAVQRERPQSCEP